MTTSNLHLFSLFQLQKDSFNVIRPIRYLHLKTLLVLTGDLYAIYSCMQEQRFYTKKITIVY